MRECRKKKREKGTKNMKTNHVIVPSSKLLIHIGTNKTKGDTLRHQASTTGS